MRVILVSVLCLCLVGCATPKRDVFTISKQVLKRNYSVVILPKEDVLSGDLDEDIRAVAGYFHEATSRRIKLAIASYSPAATARVVQEAIALNSDRNLSRLTVLYLGNRTYADVVRSVVRSVGAKFYFRELDPAGEQEKKSDE